MHSLTKKVFQLNVFPTYFTWKQYFLISGWLPPIVQHMKVQEVLISLKYFRALQYNTIQ